MHLPEPTSITATDVTCWQLQLHVPHDHPRFAGHFPGLPILPGVVQLDWAVRLARRLIPGLADHPPCHSVEQLKFQAVVTPGTTLQLVLHWNPDDHLLNFTFTHGERVCSSGRLRFEGSA